MHTNRKQNAYQVRLSAAQKAADRPTVNHQANGDEQKYSSANYPMCFTKGLEHSSDTGLILNALDFVWFREAIDEGYIDPFTTSVRASADKERAWEAPTAGVVYDLEGPDAQAVTMAPAPKLGSLELAYEMAEVYELALIRDLPLVDLNDANGADGNHSVGKAIDRLNSIGYRLDGSDGRSRTTEDGALTGQTLFRGSSPGVEVGPYLSQFLLIGNDLPTGEKVSDGYIGYGALKIDQRVPNATEADYLTVWDKWLEAQNGADLRDNASLFSCGSRFITTPRDLATYVHDDALYEAYLNACLILLGMKAPFDPSFDKLSGEGELFFNSLDREKRIRLETHKRQAGGFALYGGPHILTLVTEVATRALKAVRFQKFNTHIRLRPEALAARIERAEKIEAKFPTLGDAFTSLGDSIAPTVNAVRDQYNSSSLLPMAFQEGSPMHPSYGAGHATVAGACVTILKAFFDTDSVFVSRGEGKETKDTFARYKTGDIPVCYTALNGQADLARANDGPFLTLEGELNKLAANISIGRNMAGVHYYSDYYDSLRMGEEIAIGILEEQALCYPTDPFVLSVPTFDGEVRRIGAL